MGLSFTSQEDPKLTLRRAAMDYLARREHSRKELETKLLKRDPELDLEILDEVLTQLIEDNLLSDERFMEAFVRSKVNSGNGPVKIRYELQQKGVGISFAHVVDELCVDWYELAGAVRIKRFGEGLPSDLKDKAKQIRFLSQRGFTSEQCYSLFD